LSGEISHLGPLNDKTIDQNGTSKGSLLFDTQDGKVVLRVRVLD